MLHNQKAFIPDLTKPSVPALIHLLRHPKLWPKGFHFDYCEHETCACGLVQKFWKITPDDGEDILYSHNMAEIFAISEFTAMNIFACLSIHVFPSKVSASCIADQLEKLL